MLMTIRIDQAVRLNADITPDQSSRVELEGGGDLSFQYTTQGEMILNGRYTLSGGMVKYAMPIIPLKEFTIQDGSYVQWSGDPMDPMLNLTATERMRASVTQDDGSSRLVTFNVGVAIKQTLENLQLQFILSAPEDQSMQQELDKMGEGQRSQIAVTMLVTGMYLNMSDVGGGGKKPSLDMGAALNSFLQSEINNIAGSALKSVDITLGMEQYDQNGTGSAGNGQTSPSVSPSGSTTTGSVSYWADVFRPDRMSTPGSRSSSSTTYRSNTASTVAEPVTSSFSTTRTTRVCWKAKSRKPAPVSSCAKRCFTSVNSSSLKRINPSR